MGNWFRNCLLPAGITWDASNQPSGVYVIKATMGNRVLSKKYF